MIKKSSCKNILCSKHGPLVDTKSHCNNIVRFFFFENPYNPSPISSWFQLASGIKEVVYISDLFDPFSQWCGPAIEYEAERSKYNSCLILAITRFNFIWSGLEAYIDSLSFPACPDQRGKINSVNYFLKNHYLNKYPPIKHYSELLSYLKELLFKHGGFGETAELFLENNCVASDLIGLKVVYKIRNLFAHGAFAFNDIEYTEDYDILDKMKLGKPIEIPIIIASCKVVLMTMQMLLLASEENLKFKVAQINESEENGVSAIKYLPKMHLKSFKYS